MVVVTSTRIDNWGLDFGWERRDIGLNCCKGQALERRSIGAIDHLVKVGDISLMMLGVMNIHRCRIDERFKGVITVGQ